MWSQRTFGIPGKEMLTLGSVEVGALSSQGHRGTVRQRTQAPAAQSFRSLMHFFQGRKY